MEVIILFIGEKRKLLEQFESHEKKNQK